MLLTYNLQAMEFLKYMSQNGVSCLLTVSIKFLRPPHGQTAKQKTHTETYSNSTLITV